VGAQQIHDGGGRHLEKSQMHHMEKSQHTDFNEDTTDEGASVACSNIRL